MKRPDTYQRPVFFVLAAGLATMPLAFGGTPGWFTNLFAVYAGILALVWAIAATFRSAPSSAGIRYILAPAALPGLVVLWCFAQAWVPAPPGIAHNAWSEAAILLGAMDQTGLRPAISVNPEASTAGALRLAGYGLVFVLCYHVAAVERRAARLLALFAASGAAYALYGIGLELSESRYVLWYERDFEPGNLSSTFPNRNAFADYAALCLLCALALLYRGRLRHEDLSRGWRRATVAVSLFYLRRNGWVLYATAILFTAILMTHSRGGLIVTIIAIIVFAACATRGTLNRRASLVGAMAITVGTGALFGIAGSNTLERFTKAGTATVERMEIFRLTIDAIGDRPVLGTGLGTFSDIFAAYRTETLLPRIDFAHNSYLENAMEMGVPAAIAFYTGLAMLFFFFVRSFRHNRRAHPYPALAIAAMTVAFLHSLFDYAEQFPVVAITFAAILGVSAARSFNVPDPVTAHDEDNRRRS